MVERKSAIELVAEIASIKKQNPGENAHLTELKTELKSRSTTEIVDADTELQFYNQNPLYITTKGVKDILGINVPRNTRKGTESAREFLNNVDKDIKDTKAILKPLIALLETELKSRDVNELKAEIERLATEYGIFDLKRRIGTDLQYDKGAYMQLILKSIIAEREGFRKSVRANVNPQTPQTSLDNRTTYESLGKEPADD